MPDAGCGLVIASDASQQCGDICDLGRVFAIGGYQVTTQFAKGHKCFVVVPDAGQQQADLGLDIECALVPSPVAGDQSERNARNAASASVFSPIAALQIAV